MSWPMQTPGQWNPAIAMTPNMNIGAYTAEQYWQQWAQWQQQYAQWQSHYGDKYAEQMQAMQAMGGMPPLPPSSAAPPPAPPPPEQPPPPPPHENNQPLYGKSQSLPTPVPPPNENQRNTNTVGHSDNFAGNNQTWSYTAEVRPDMPQLSDNTEALKKLAEEERLFDIQFQKWEEEIEKWRQENVNHPDKQKYTEYEQKFETCRQQLLERRQQMKQKRACLLNNSPQPASSTVTANNKISTAVPPPLQNTNNNFNQQPQNYQNKPLQNTTNQNSSKYQQYNVSGFGRNNNKSADSQDRFESYQHMESYSSPNGDKSNFLPTSGSTKGIPGLDLVTDIDKGAKKHQDVIDITDDQMDVQPTQTLAPDYSTISKGINNILGDEKIMNILSMVRGQNIPVGGSNIPNANVSVGAYLADNKNDMSHNNQSGNDNTYNNQLYGNRPPNMNFNRDDPNLPVQQNNLTHKRMFNDDRSRGMTQDQYFERDRFGQQNIPSRDIPPLMRSNMLALRPPLLEAPLHQNTNDFTRGPNNRAMLENRDAADAGAMLANRRAPDNRDALICSDNRSMSNIRGMLDNRGTSGNRGIPDNRTMYDSKNILDNRGIGDSGGMPSNRGVSDNRGMPANRGIPDVRNIPENIGMHDHENLIENDSRNQLPIRKTWVEEPLFTPSVIVEYEHKPLRLKARDFLEPVHMFDYNHKSKDEEYKKKDFEKEANELFTRKPRRQERDDDHLSFDKGDRFLRDHQSRDYERRIPRDDFRSRSPPRDKYDDRRHADYRYDDRRRDERDRYARREDVYRERDRERDLYRDRDINRDRFRDIRREDRQHSRSQERDTRKRALSRESELSESSKKSKDDSKKVETPRHIVMIDDILESPGRDMRPEKIVIILRGPPGSGKSYLAKLIRDREAEYGGTARIMSIDDYFMQEGEIEEKDPSTGKIVKKPSLKYEYEEKLEETYVNSLKRAFKRSLTDGYFTFLIYDAVNDQLKSYADVWNFARQNGFQVYICTMDLDPQVCFKRNIHNRTLEDIQVISARFFPTPAHHIELDPTTLLQSAAIPDVQMEDVTDTIVIEDEQDNEVESVFTSKWEKMEDAAQLARLDGTSKPLRPSQLSMEDYLQLDDWKPNAAKPGKKSVRWADIEERRQQEKMRAIGFVVGQTDWNRMTDPTMGSSALTQTKYIERVRRN